jgi:hypothetical protein
MACPKELRVDNGAVQWLMLLLLIRKILVSSLGPEIRYPDFYPDFPQSLRANTRITPKINLRLRSSILSD